LLWGGKPGAIIKAAEDLKLRIFTSEEIITEISHVLTYPKLKKIYKAEGLRREDLIETILKIAKFVKATKKFNAVREHPADDKFLSCALAAGADYVISGDKHLLKLIRHGKTKILPVNKFLQVLETAETKASSQP
jgi:putative PIN family toxin of toxin-antitoxin system